MRLTDQLSLPAWLMHYFLIDFCSGAPWVRNLVIYVSKKFWFGENRSYGLQRPCVRPPLRVSRDAVNCIASGPFRDKTTTTKADSFFCLLFNVYIDVNNRES